MVKGERRKEREDGCAQRERKWPFGYRRVMRFHGGECTSASGIQAPALISAQTMGRRG